MKVLEQWLSHPYLQLDCCSSAIVFAVLWFIASKITAREWVWRIAGGCSLAVFVVILTALLMPAPEIEFFAVVHALIRGGLLAFLTLIVLVIILPVIAWVWEQTAVRFHRGLFQFINDVENWSQRRRVRIQNQKAERKREHERRGRERYQASLPPPPPPPTYEELAQKAKAKRDEGLRVAALIEDEIDREFENADVEQEYRDDLQKAKRFWR